MSLNDSTLASSLPMIWYDLTKSKCLEECWCFHALTHIAVSSAIRPTKTDQLHDHMKLAIISSQLHGSGNQNTEWKRKLKTFQKKTTAEECYYFSCILNFCFIKYVLHSTSGLSTACAYQFNVKEHFLFNSHWEILIPLKGSSDAVHIHFWRNKTAVLTFNIL